jgi:hypothetical protein
MWTTATVRNVNDRQSRPPARCSSPAESSASRRFDKIMLAKCPAQ